VVLGVFVLGTLFLVRVRIVFWIWVNYLVCCRRFCLIEG